MQTWRTSMLVTLNR